MAPLALYHVRAHLGFRAQTLGHTKFIVHENQDFGKVSDLGKASNFEKVSDLEMASDLEYFSLSATVLHAILVRKLFFDRCV